MPFGGAVLIWNLILTIAVVLLFIHTHNLDKRLVTLIDKLNLRR